MGADETYVGECRGVTLPDGTEHEGQWIGGELRIKTNKEMPVDPVEVNTSSYVSSIIQLARSFSGCASRNRTSTADILRTSSKGSSAMKQEHEGQWIEGNFKTNTNKEERDGTSTADILRPSLKGSSVMKQEHEGQWKEGNLKTNTNKEERDRTSTADILRASLKGSSATKQERDVESSVIPVDELQDSDFTVTCLCFGQEDLHKVRF